MPIAKRALLFGAILMVLAVAIGAFGAHALIDRLLANDKLAVFSTANDYHFHHALGLLIVGVFYQTSLKQNASSAPVYLLFFGVLVFSGSLYLLSIFNLTWMGMLTPIGGLCMILGWTVFIVSIVCASTK